MHSIIIIFYLISNFFGKIQAFNCTNGEVIDDINRCSSLAQCSDCSDEVNCTGKNHRYIPCRSINGQYIRCISEENLCDGHQNCYGCWDEMNCSNSRPLFFCDGNKKFEQCFDPLPKNKTGQDPNIRNSFCDGDESCSDRSDEKRIGFGFKCFTNGNVSTSSVCVISQSYLLQASPFPDFLICENSADKCFSVINNKIVFDESKCWTCLDGTIIQRQQVCNSVFDCPDLSDECLCFQENRELNCEQLLQGKDCTSLGSVSCPNENKCISTSSFCDKNNDCSDGFDERFCNSNGSNCSLVSFVQQISCDRWDLQNRISIRCDGVIECIYAEDECSQECPDESQYCPYISKFDEMVRVPNSTCDFKVQDMCNQIPNCADGADEKHCPNLVPCDVKNPSSGFYDKRECGPDRCNLEAVCDNLQDELGCSDATHYYCDDNKTFISRSQVFDGIYDCNDFSDECDFSNTSVSSPTHLIRYPFLYIFLWILMFLSVVGNGIVIVGTLKQFYATRRRFHSMNRVGVCNKIMILNLAVSDFLMGIYLFVIAVKSAEFSGNYCRHSQAWLQSSLCEFAGILALISSEASVFLMVLMTSYRLYGVTNPFRAEKLRCKIIYFATGFIWFLSILFAIVPIFPSLKLSFASAILVSHPYGTNMLTIPHLLRLTSNANRLPGINFTIREPTVLNLQSFCELFERGSMPSYCYNQTEVGDYVFGYYGDDGVCLPRLYGGPNDPTSAYTIAIVSLNFIAFIFIVVAYLFIYFSTSLNSLQGDQPSCSSVDETRSKENKKLWEKIMSLIVTDFICWIPICTMAFLSFSGSNLPDLAYPVTAVLLIPINSAVNPWLYSSFLTNCSSRFYQAIMHFFKRKRKTKTTSIRSERTAETCTRIRSSPVIGSLDILPSSPSSCENTVNDNLTVATEL